MASEQNRLSILVSWHLHADWRNASKSDVFSGEGNNGGGEGTLGIMAREGFWSRCDDRDSATEAGK